MNCTGSIHKGIYNCYGNIDDCLCYDCKHNSESTAQEKQERFIDYRDKIDILYKYLMGIELPGRFCLSRKMPKLSAKMAFGVIYILQEEMRCLPDCIEQCKVCKELFDTDGGGCNLDDQYKYRVSGRTVGKRYWGHYCENCIPNIDIEVK